MIDVMSFQAVMTQKNLPLMSTDDTDLKKIKCIPPINTDCSGSGKENVELPKKIDRARPTQ
jgi:hypothetical protein